MNKGISFYWGFKASPEERVKLLKNIGFNSVITNEDEKLICRDGSIGKQASLFKEYGLKLSSLHMRYRAEELPYFWLKGTKGNWLEKRLVRDVKMAYKYGFPYVVVHLGGMPSKVGLERIKRVLDVCQKLNIYLAVENLDYNDCFEYLFDDMQHPNLKFCCDIGHTNIFDKHIDFIDKYSDKLICVHLHDNDGRVDTHTLNRYGTIDWDKIAQKLARIGFNGSLDYEIKTCGELSMEQGAKEVYKQARELEKMINKYKKQYKSENKNKSL